MKMTPVKKQIILLTLFFLATVALWNTFIIYPIKLFVVLLHEMSHGLMAILFGGSIIEIQIDPRIGGYCKYTLSGGAIGRFFIASAGYLGSMFWGGVILTLASKMKEDKHITMGIGVISLILSYFVIQTGEWFGIVFTLGFAAFMIVSALFIKNPFHDYLLKFIGLTSCLYVVLDIKDDLISRSGIGSDADAIAAMTGIPSIVVGILWIALAIFMLYIFLRNSIKHSANETTSSQ